MNDEYMPNTIYNPDIFRTSKPYGFDGVFDWSFVDECWENKKDKPMDIDMFKERRGHFLVVETKKPDVPIPKGQMIAFERLHKLGCFTIMFIWGKPQPESAEAWYPGSTQKVFLNSRWEIIKFVRRWYTHAENNPR